MKSSFHRVFFIAFDDYLSSFTARINPSDSFHIIQVLRLTKGDRVLVSTMTGKYEAEIMDANPNAVVVKLGLCIESMKEDLLYILLIQALPKLKKMDDIIEKATEFGVMEIVPVISERSQVTLNAPSMKGKEDRWKRVAMAASKQSRSLKPTLIHPPQLLGDWANHLDYQEEMLKILLWEHEEQQYLIDLLPLVKQNNKIALCVGPEGGFTIKEAHMLIQKGFVPCSLGRQILKTETAGPFAAGFLKCALEGRQ